MKRKIRRGCFETNSSSMHSLVILNDDNLSTELNKKYSHYYLNRDGMLDWRYLGDRLYFGRSPFQYLHTIEDKTQYAIASLCGFRKNAHEIFEEIEKIVMEIIPDCKGIMLPKEKYYIDNDDLYLCSESGEDEEDFYYGGVDEDILSSFLENYNISLKEFISDDKYVVVVDGDEYCIFKDMKESGLINVDNVAIEWTDQDAYDYEEEKKKKNKEESEIEIIIEISGGIGEDNEKTDQTWGV